MFERRHASQRSGSEESLGGPCARCAWSGRNGGLAVRGVPALTVAFCRNLAYKRG